MASFLSLRLGGSLDVFWPTASEQPWRSTRKFPKIKIPFSPLPLKFSSRGSTNHRAPPTVSYRWTGRPFLIFSKIHESPEDTLIPRGLNGLQDETRRYFLLFIASSFSSKSGNSGGRKPWWGWFPRGRRNEGRKVGLEASNRPRIVTLKPVSARISRVARLSWAAPSIFFADFAPAEIYNRNSPLVKIQPRA